MEVSDLGARRAAIAERRAKSDRAAMCLSGDVTPGQHDGVRTFSIDGTETTPPRRLPEHRRPDGTVDMEIYACRRLVENQVHPPIPAGVLAYAEQLRHGFSGGPVVREVERGGVVIDMAEAIAARAKECK